MMQEKDRRIPRAMREVQRAGKPNMTAKLLQVEKVPNRVWEETWRVGGGRCDSPALGDSWDSCSGFSK